MKVQVLDTEGKKTKEITTELFEEPIREDLIFKVIEAEKTRQPYKPKQYAGMNRSASGKVQHKRHSWNTDRGRGMSRIPKKTMWRRGTQFSWIGAIIPSVKGGRRAHPPHGDVPDRKINKKELKKVLLSTLTFVSSADEVKKKYTTLVNKKIETKFPIIVEDKILKLKTKELMSSLKKILGEMFDVAIQKKSQRSGIGKLRGRKYKKSAGALLVIGAKENAKIQGIDVLKVSELNIGDLADGGARITIFTENAIKDLESVMEGHKGENRK
jgi:large subunit ribosomal protein L4e